MQNFLQVLKIARTTSLQYIYKNYGVGKPDCTRGLHKVLGAMQLFLNFIDGFPKSDDVALLKL